MPFGTLEPYGDRARRREGFEPHVLAFSLRRKCCGQFGGSDLPPAGHSLPPHPPSYSPFGLITLSLRVHTLSQAKQKHMCNKLKFEKGFEFSRLAAARSGSALTAVQGCHSLPSPFESPVPKGKERFQRSFPFGLPWGIRTPNRQNRNLILYPIALRADIKSLAGFSHFLKDL